MPSFPWQRSDTKKFLIEAVCTESLQSRKKF